MAGVTQGSNLGPLVFLIYINEMKFNTKLFADDMSLFTIVNDKNESAYILNNDLLLISRWTCNWKIVFNPDPIKPVQEVIFSRKKQFQTHPTISLNNIQVERASYQKHLGIILDENLNFKQYVDNVISKINKGIFVINQLCHSLPRKSLITIYNAFLRPLISYGDIICDQPQKQSFCEKLESLQYKAALAITGTTQGTSREKIYQDLGLESLKTKRWYRRLSCMFKIINKAPNYLLNLIQKNQHTNTNRINRIPNCHFREDCFKYSFFPSTWTLIWVLVSSRLLVFP